MNSLLLNTLARGIFTLLLLVSLYLLYRGHNAPGGGFIGGLVAAVAFALVAKGMGLEAAKKALRFEPRSIAACGLLVAIASGLAGYLYHNAFFTGQWWFLGASNGQGGFPLSTVMLFDVGVYLVVLGATMSFFFCLEDPES